MDGRKSLFFAYLFALIGGPFGLHHLYLGRTQHAVLWFTTLGGFGLGWIYEMLFLISKYVREANCDHHLVLQHYLRMRQKKSPAFEILRFCGKTRNRLQINDDYYSIIQNERFLFRMISNVC